MKQREIVVEHKYVDGIYSHCFDNENYTLLELERKVYLNENKELEDRINKAIEYINEMTLTSDGYANYGDDLRPEHIIEILEKEVK